MAKTVADIMTTDLIVVQEEDNLQTLEPGMQVFGMRHLPVVDGDKLVGLLSHRDVLRLAISSLTPDTVHAAVGQQKQADTFVAAVMQRELTTVAPETPVAEAGRLLLAKRIGCLPVVDADRKLLGLVTEYDLLRDLLEDTAPA